MVYEPIGPENENLLSSKHMPINNLAVDVSGIEQCKIVSLDVKGLEVKSIKLHQ